MCVFSQRSTILTVFMIALLLVITGCGGGSNTTTVTGQANFPSNLGGSPVANAQVSFVDLTKPAANDPSGTKYQTTGTTTTDANGKYSLDVPQTPAGIVLAPGTAQGQTVPNSGVVEADQDSSTKNLNGNTTCACFAILFAVQGGAAPQLFTTQRIANCEQAAAAFTSGTNFLSLDSIVACANAVRKQTDDCAHL